MSSPVRPLRADARRNREAILAAAAGAFAQTGSDISMDEVARLAGVGVGTVYRRFPTKDALLAALCEQRMTEFAEFAEASAARAADDPWPGFEAYVRFLTEQQAQDLTFSELLRDPARGSAAFRDQHRRVLRAEVKLVSRAVTAGVVRADLHHADLLLLIDANHGVLVAHRHAARSSDARRASRRLVALMLDSFRATAKQRPHAARQQLPGQPPRDQR